VFKDDVTETWVGSLRSADGVHFRGAPELVLPSMWAPGKATHNLAILFLNGSYYFAGGRDRGCRIFARNQPGCRPADPRERGIWMSRSTAGIHYHLDGDGKAGSHGLGAGGVAEEAHFQRFLGLHRSIGGDALGEGGTSVAADQRGAAQQAIAEVSSSDSGA
jgi:hypothetical protein